MCKRKISTLHFIIVFSIFAIILVILLCLPKYSQEQLEALERLDPKKYLTENDYVFSLTREELLEEKLNKKIFIAEDSQIIGALGAAIIGFK